MTSRDCSFRLAVDGWALATRLDAGPMVARARASNALRTESSFFVGPDDELVGGEARVRLVQGAPRAAFTTAAGAFIHEGNADSPPVALGAARHVSLAAEGRAARVVVADPAGLAWCDWPADVPDAADADAPPTALLLTRTPVARADVRVVEAALSGGRMLVLYALPDPVLGVLYVGPDDVRDVRLRLPAPVAHLDVEWVGEQVGVALLLDNGQSMACVLDARGTTRVKPYVVLGARRDGLSPRVLWSERGFKVAAPCSADGSVRLLSMGTTDDPELVVEGVQGPMDAVYFAQRYYFASVTEGTRDGAPEATLQLRSVARDGGASQTLECPLLPADGSARLRQRALLARLRALESELRGVGYRSSGKDGAAVRREDCQLWLQGTTAVALSARAEQAHDVLVVRWGRSDPDAEPPSFPRLRRWFGVERDPTPQEEQQLETLRAAVPHAAARVLTTDDSCALELDLAEFPSVPQLAGVLRGLTG